MSQKVALITGGARGLGLAIARRLAGDGLLAVLADRLETVHDAAKSIRDEGYAAGSIVADLQTPRAVANLIQTVRERHAGIDVLVNNAAIVLNGQGGVSKLEETTIGEWDAVTFINLTAPFLLCQAAFADMKPKGWGRIINISSRAGRTHVAGSSPAYGATKSGLIGLTRYVAAEGGALGITANVIAPGRFDTPLANTYSRDEIARAVSNVPVGRVGHPEEVAATVSFLASDGAGYITGAIIDVNGGAFMG